MIGVLAGAISGGSLTSGGGGQPVKKAEAAVEAVQTNQEILVPQPVVTERANPAPKNLEKDQEIAEVKKVLRQLIAWLSSFPPGILIGIVSLGIFFMTGICLLFAWLSSRFKFVWLNAIIHNDAAISKPFREYRKEGDSIFKLSIVVSLLMLVFLGVIGGWIYFSFAAAGFFKGSSPSAVPAVISIIAAGMIFMAGIMIVVIWSAFVDHFVVPIMALDRETYLPAWKKFVKICKNNKNDFLIFVLVIVGLGIACSILEGVLMVIVFLAGAMIAAVIFGIGYLVFNILLKAKILFIGFAVGAGIPMLFAFLFLLFAVILPFAVFFRAFSLYFLSSLNEGYAPLALNQAQEAR